MTTYTAKPVDSRGWALYTDQENHTWQTLFNRQIKILPQYACQEHRDGLNQLALKADAIPQIPDLNQAFLKSTGWQTKDVSALISNEEFFTLLSERIFPVATFIRIPEELDYLPEPDIFHEVFGHCPMLTHPLIASFVEAYGRYALTANPEQLERLSRLFWFTIEFGLINTPQGIRCYGGGILSSYQETRYAIDDAYPKRLPFDLLEVLRTPFRIDKMQGIYFVLDSFEQLFAVLQGDTLALTIEEACHLEDRGIRVKD